MQIAHRHATGRTGRRLRAGDPGSLRRPADGKRAPGHGPSAGRPGIGFTEEVWLFGLPLAARAEIAAALEDWGVVPVALDGDPSAVPCGTPAALVVGVEGLSPTGLPRELTLGWRSCQVPVVALDEGLEALGLLDGLRAFSHVLVLPSREASAVVGALEWVLSPSYHRRDATPTARARAPFTRHPV